MKTNLLFFSIVSVLLLMACGGPSQSTASLTETAVSTTHIPETVAAPTATVVSTKRAVAQPTSKPTAVPTVLSAQEVDPYTLARQIITQGTLPPGDGWQVAPCEGEATVLCISDGSETVGFAELLLFPLSGYAEDHPLRLAAAELPAKANSYTADHFILAREALNSLAQEYLDVIAADCATAFPDDAFTSSGMEPAQLGALPALSFGFVRTSGAGVVQERSLSVAAFDQQFVYWFGINYDPAYVSTFVSDTAVTQFAPYFFQLAARLPVGGNLAAEPSTQLPMLLPDAATEGFPYQPTWTLAADLPTTPETAVILSQPDQPAPLTSREATELAQQVGFDKLFVDVSGGLSPTQAAEWGQFVAFDGTRTLSLSSRPFSFSDVANWNQGPDLPFAQAAPIAAAYLQENGWLTFPYEIAASSQGQGVLFLPVFEGIILPSPAFAVQVAGNGHVSGMSISPLDNLTPTGEVIILTAEAAWQQVQANTNQPSIQYGIVPPDTAVAISLPVTHINVPPVGEIGDFYTNIWAFQSLTGEGEPILQSSHFFRVTGEAAMLYELAKHNASIVHLRGRVSEETPGIQTLALTAWEATQMGSLPIVYGTLQQDGSRWRLREDGSRTEYVLPDPPDGLQEGDTVTVTGLPQASNGVDHLIWQEITVYPSQPEAGPQPTDVPIQSVAIDRVALIYLPQPATVTGRPDNQFIPAWAFSGVADNGAQVGVWVTAVLPSYFTSPSP